MNIRKISAALISAAMIAGMLTACGQNSSSADAPASVTVSTPEMAPIRSISSIELIKEMKVGWNLGNTLDSLIGNPNGTELPSDWETAWGQPVTTKAMIDSVKAQGFNVLRVPVTWEGKFSAAPDYTINADWLARVKEIVDYGIENDMFVILNMHHEEWNMPTAENQAAADEILRALWSQIADHFADYNEKLIFEGMNEPRLKGTPMEWNGGNAEAREVINCWNASFVETIRSKGGNHTDRHLMIPTYAASSLDSVLSEFRIPEDDKVIVSVHAYLPYSFALADNASGTKEWSADNANDTRDIDSLFEKLKTLYIDNGQAVIIGEFGSRNRMNNEARENCARYYITKATEAGIPCVWWDNNAFVGSGENFGLFDRKTFEWRYPDIITAMMEAREGTTAQ
ncbi:MAG: glycoside hydrolase family 5 protein [Oscillospiraceae bacterium]|nr:glycoside hydrolase family 5 protein [Oscillospiraceae bacterium]